MKKDTILVAVVVLVVGLIIGWIVGQKSAGPTPASVKAPSAPMQQPSMPMANAQQKIGELKAIVAREPNNRQAWVALGNLHFDADQPMDAIEAYQKALDLNANDANVLTDQGVMFRRLGQFDRAIDNFTRAYQADPVHGTSLFNLGIVYRYDLQNFAKAQEAWSKFLAINPSGPGSDRVRQELEFLNKQSTVSKP
jgi:tetratricopeptide (TPR) repeat protein